MQATARHRREPSVRQRIRASIGVLAALAAIAAFGVLTGTLPSQPAWQQDLTRLGPAWLIAWLSCALPLAGVFGLIAPTPLARLRIAVSSILLLGGAVLAAGVGEPADAGFARAQTAAASALLVVGLLGAIGATLAFALDNRRDTIFRLRRCALWTGPLALTATLAAAALA
jgi:hypothetical protein